MRDLHLFLQIRHTLGSIALLLRLDADKKSPAVAALLFRVSTPTAIRPTLFGGSEDSSKVSVDSHSAPFFFN